ncbi:Aminotransferase_class IV domain-containing protein [Hexamita inflata]|uniref:Aminotransferase class IV domain-containing protein n=1 Tax=Hexamita inflata TaxID=28002 RepID=A0AA86QW15_9EUKA|nr:Aminotransferase class IV domain-containing protein [Hexamita inflata]
MQTSESLQLTHEKSSGHDQITLHSNSAYTTMRTVGKRVFRFQQHLSRLHDALIKNCKNPMSIEQIRDKIRAQFALLPNNSDLRIYIFISYVTQQLSLFAEPFTIAAPISQFFTVQLTRPDPSIKDDVWVKMRQQAEGLLSEVTNEVIIYNENKVVTEGLSSNVFVLRSGRVFTAPAGLVLDGTMRQTVILACKKLGVEVIEAEYTLDDLEAAEEVMVCSTSRYVVCGQKVNGKEKQVDLGLKIRKETEKLVLEECEDV